MVAGIIAGNSNPAIRQQDGNTLQDESSNNEADRELPRLNPPQRIWLALYYSFYGAYDRTTCARQGDGFSGQQAAFVRGDELGAGRDSGQSLSKPAVVDVRVVSCHEIVGVSEDVRIVASSRKSGAKVGTVPLFRD